MNDNKEIEVREFWNKIALIHTFVSEHKDFKYLGERVYKFLMMDLCELQGKFESSGRMELAQEMDKLVSVLGVDSYVLSDDNQVEEITYKDIDEDALSDFCSFH